MSYRSEKATGSNEIHSPSDAVYHLIRAYQVSGDDAGELVGKYSEDVQKGISFGSHVSYITDQIASGEGLKPRHPVVGEPVELFDFDDEVRSGLIVMAGEDGSCSVKLDGDDFSTPLEPYLLAWTGEKWIAADEEVDDES